MNVFSRFFRSMRDGMSLDTHFETYYGSLVRNLGDNAPNAAEARRDYQSVRNSLDRVGMF